MPRVDWDRYFIEISEIVATRNTCLRRGVGAVVVKDNRILATGYNGAPSGIKHCSEIGCIRKKMNIPSGERHELCRGIHAEQNAIVQAAKFGISLIDSTIYINTQPCTTCAKLIANVGIRRVVYTGTYPDKNAIDILVEAGLEVANVIL